MGEAVAVVEAMDGEPIGDTLGASYGRKHWAPTTGFEGGRLKTSGRGSGVGAVPGNATSYKTHMPLIHQGVLPVPRAESVPANLHVAKAATVKYATSTPRVQCVQ